MKNILSQNNDHDMYRLELPWLVNGTLDAQSTLLLKKHLTNCDSCREELTSLTAMQNAIADSPVADLDTQASFERMQKRINNESHKTGVSLGAKISRMMQSIIGSVPAPQWVLASVCGVLIGFLILQLGPWPPTEDTADYHVLSSGELTDNLTVYARINSTLSQSDAEKLLHELSQSAGIEAQWNMTDTSEFRTTIAQNDSQGVLLPEKLSELLNSLRQSPLIGEAGIAPDPQ